MSFYFKQIIFAAFVASLASGCITADGTFFGQSKQQQQQKQMEQRKQQMAVINRDNRITELENSMILIRSEFDSINNAITMQNQRIANLEANFSRESNAHSSDIVELNRELEQIRSYQKQLRTNIDSIPQNFSKLLNEQEKQIIAKVDDKVNQVKLSNADLITHTSSSSSQPNYTGACYEHIVESGQTISEIAQAYKVSQKEIMEVNKIKDAARIRVGQKLYIPKH
ncbi:MAG: LysM peptidoglycan-binding domain-containing protein [Kiritimatiellae bacterium]|nr:LysM peptidoglycan-binding domain-containing protein [Kiritimatiellia bacterium]